MGNGKKESEIITIIKLIKLAVIKQKYLQKSAGT